MQVNIGFSFDDIIMFIQLHGECKKGCMKMVKLIATFDYYVAFKEKYTDIIPCLRRK